MHELSIAMNIIDIVEEEMNKYHATNVGKIELEIGSLSGVVPEMLEFALKESMQDHPVKHAKIVINHIQAEGKCEQCGLTQKIETFYDPCSHCGNYNLTIKSGRELNIKSIEIS